MDLTVWSHFCLLWALFGEGTGNWGLVFEVRECGGCASI